MTDKLEPLKPLTAKQQDEFDRRRETASVVQNKCLTCSAWYETPKRATAYTEVFRCDCGAPMSFTVPALDVVLLGSPGMDLDDRLDTGMKIKEAIANACYWWNSRGRHMMRKDGGKGSDIAVSLNPESENFSPSGILNGQTWDYLDLREKIQITKAWHNFYVRKGE